MRDGEIFKEGTPYEIFSDDKLISECYLQKPLILEIFENLCKSGEITSYKKIPRNKEELFEIINSKGKIS